MFIIEYYILDKRYTAGPYFSAEINEQFDDITSYEGVSRGKIIPAVLFYKSNEPQGFLNNFKKSRMYIYNHWWNNVETPYQAMKCVKSEDFKAIWACSTPREARDLGQKVQMVPHWDEVKLDVMEECVTAKFLQNQDFLKQLIATGDAELIENSPIDSFWGWGGDKQGLNHLGKILMKVREKLKDY